MNRPSLVSSILILVLAAWLCHFQGSSARASLHPLSTQATAPEFQLLQSDYQEIRFSVTLNGFQNETVSTPAGDFTSLSLDDEGYSTEVGTAALPVIRRLVEIPYGAQVSLEYGPIVRHETTLAECQWLRILPLQAPVAKRPGSEKAADFVLNQTAYSRSGFIISEIAYSSQPLYLRGHRFVLVEIHPLNYCPSDGRLCFYDQIEIRLKLTGSDAALTGQMKTRYNHPNLEALARKLSLNTGCYDETELATLPLGLLIITNAHYAGLSEMQELVQWKQHKGFHTTVATTDQIGTTNAQIRAYLQNAYETWAIPPDFVMLIGDTDVIPPWNRANEIHPGTDLYYATLEGQDLFGDVGLGRVSVANDSDLINYVHKILNYEQALWIGDDWEKAAVFMASNDNWELTESTHDAVIAQYLQPESYHSDRLYCHTFGATSAQVSTAINAGRSLATYAGHGYFFCWQDGPPFLQRDVQALTNVYYPFVGSFACDTGQFMRGSECFGETWIRSAHGAIAYWGAAATSYWVPDDILERALYEAVFDQQSPREHQNLTWTAGMTDYAKIKHWIQEGGNLLGVYYCELYNLLGDPTVDIWTDIPHSLTVVAPDSIQIGQTNLQINVNGYPDWALVNVSSSAELLQYSGYVMNGSVNLSLGSGFTQPGTMHICATGHDCCPWQGTAVIVPTTQSADMESIGNDLSTKGIWVSPNPFNPTTAIRYELPTASYLSLQVYDVVGRLVVTLVEGWRDAGADEVSFDGSKLSSGLYFVQLKSGDNTGVEKMMLLK
jgi:hypothetical protein